jgi:glucoamylase
MPPGKILRIETTAPAVIHWGADDWNTVQDTTVHDVGLGIHIADLATKTIPEGRQIQFTFYWPEADRWEGADFIVHVGSLRQEERS